MDRQLHQHPHPIDHRTAVIFGCRQKRRDPRIGDHIHHRAGRITRGLLHRHWLQLRRTAQMGGVHQQRGALRYCHLALPGLPDGRHPAGLGNGGGHLIGHGDAHPPDTRAALRPSSPGPDRPRWRCRSSRTATAARSGHTPHRTSDRSGSRPPDGRACRSSASGQGSREPGQGSQPGNGRWSWPPAPTSSAPSRPGGPAPPRPRPWSERGGGRLDRSGQPRDGRLKQLKN